jgi:Mor family transcriptional regulator
MILNASKSAGGHYSRKSLLYIRRINMARGKQSKLNSEQMNHMYDSSKTLTAKQLAEIYKVSLGTVYNVVNKVRNGKHKFVSEAQINLDFDKGKE